MNHSFLRPHAVTLAAAASALLLACETKESPPVCPGGPPAPSSGGPAWAAEQGLPKTCQIPCLVGLADNCASGGTCTWAQDAETFRTCYGNGVRTEQRGPQQAGDVSISTYRRGDGSVCYVVEARVDPMTRRATFLYKSADGQPLAEMSLNATEIGSPALRSIVRCNGQDYAGGSSGCFDYSGALGDPWAVTESSCDRLCHEGDCPPL